MANRKQNFQPVAWFWDLFQRERLNLEPPYQRRSVWNQTYKDHFVDTVLLNYPAPAIFLYEEISPEGLAQYAVVDGKQRLTTLFEFASNVFPVSDRAERSSARGRYFQDLDPEIKRGFWSYQFSVEYLPSADEALINNMFDRLNRNTAKLSPQELRHARHSGLFISKAEDLADWMTDELTERFPRIMAGSRRQMKDVEFVATLLLLLEEGAKGYSTDALDEAFAGRDEEWAAQASVEQRFRDTITFVKAMVESPRGQDLARSRMRNQADFYSLFGAVDSLATQGLLPSASEAADRLVNFAAQLSDDAARGADRRLIEYYEAARSASSDAGPRRARIRIISEVMQNA